MLEAHHFKDPIKTFSAWFEQSIKLGETLPEAASLGTANKDGKPSVRIVLFKGLLGGNFTFYTNYESRKGKDLAENPFAALTFHWLKQKRQVRIEGRVEKLNREDSERYFHSRPRGSQVGAWVSHQDQVIPNREFLETKMAEYEKKFEGSEIPLPPYWGGYRLSADTIEFWEERENRLHDRFVCTRNSSGWKIEQISP